MSGSVDVPKAVLVPHGKSHPFVQRECILKEPAKVGRSLVKTKIQQNNFIFDCRVLSRNHAVIWYQDNKVNGVLKETGLKTFFYLTHTHYSSLYKIPKVVMERL